MDFNKLFYLNFVVNLSFLIGAGLYFILKLQWYNYKLYRAIFHHKKWHWWVLFFVIPVMVPQIIKAEFSWIFLLFYYFGLINLHFKLDKKLVFTYRVKRFIILLVSIATLWLLALPNVKLLFIPILLAWGFSLIAEYLMAYYYEYKALAKLKNMPKLTIILITASFGKTSIKNFLYQILKQQFNCYKTPRSVNVKMGIIADINNNLEKSHQVYIAEAGARQKNDILEITQMLKPQYVILGKVGEQHIEYFKTLDNIKAAKGKILQSDRLIKGFVHESAGETTIHSRPKDNLIVFKNSFIKDLKSNLEGLSWQLETPDLQLQCQSALLGNFHALNISLCVLLCLEIGLEQNQILKAIKKLEPTKHRLEKLETDYKLIIDDSFNGNLEGMLEAIRLSSMYKDGQKIIVTPGIIESNEESNIKLAQAINEVFDMCYITGAANRQILADHIDHFKRKRIFSKKSLEMILKKETKPSDLILFANDAPDFI